MPRGAGWRIGILGGSFNPAHAGHLHLSRQAMRWLGLDRVWWLVSPQNPLKPAAGMASLADRVAGARAVAAADRRIVVSAIEAELGLRFTADTVACLRALWPGQRFVWLMGADNLGQIARWQRWSRIFHTLPIAVCDRDSYAYGALAGKAATRFRQRRLTGRTARQLADMRPPAWVFLAVRRHTASATAIRAQRAADTHATGVLGTSAGGKRHHSGCDAV
ncbi:MAG: nicotinate-nucleotide adenylyltransferase [Alphaproteobacteria bacterium]